MVDAFQGVEAQTVANAYAAMAHNLTIVPVINKIDLTHARVDEVKEEIEHTLALDVSPATWPIGDTFGASWRTLDSASSGRRCGCARPTSAHRCSTATGR